MKNLVNTYQLRSGKKKPFNGFFFGLGWGVLEAIVRYINKGIYTKKIGKTVFVAFNINGTSDTTTITFTLPYTNASEVSSGGALTYAIDNSAELSTVGRASMGDGTTTVNVSKLYSAAWTASGQKVAMGQFSYEAD